MVIKCTLLLLYFESQFNVILSSYILILLLCFFLGGGGERGCGGCILKPDNKTVNIVSFYVHSNLINTDLEVYAYDNH